MKRKTSEPKRSAWRRLLVWLDELGGQDGTPPCLFLYTKENNPMDRMIPTSRDMGFEDPPVPEKPVDVALDSADRIATALESIAKSLEKFVKAAIDDGEFGVTTYPGKFAK